MQKVKGAKKTDEEKAAIWRTETTTSKKNKYIYICMQRNGINRVTKVRKIQGTRTGNQETNRNRKGGRTKKRKA